ncbi:THUMP domain-containing class I SAM-dependent RNA methyltransferase [Sandaracinus amylolyticus]|uniref:Methyltransferase n=1 Tax=Sandaracinus amylolyticus TaxID=927083 RepID=A0A0F6W317_9BACT|nr:RNA methyltransferase [Sandaracinus amylolyticus]AKF06200.1 Methyltransferase [Sandaracinus amylolyticus]AYM52200.1 RNA methylase [Sandaracinus amylolyticus]
MQLAIFVACAPGLEPLLAEEMRALGCEPHVERGGVETSGDRDTLATLLVELGLASHVLVRVASFHAKDLDRIEQHVARLPWSGWLRRDVPRRVRATAQRSRVFHTGAITERVERAIRARLGDDPKGGDEIPIVVRLFEDRCTISIDASGDALHRRGYRLDPHRAPLREDLARALVIASGWDGVSLLVDPMCGSGTIAIEAARIAMGHAPGLERGFAMERTALDDGVALAQARERARSRLRPSVATIVARDRDAKAIDAARANAERAGVLDAITFEVGALSTAASAIGPGVTRGATPRVVTNPPWGERLGPGPDLRALHRGLGQLRRALGDDVRLTIAAHDRKLAYATGLPLKSAFLTDLGGLKVQAMVEG